ncbi:MAG: Hsp20/alpha crystallin family protein [Chloroflexaceae bacterium]|nr:Hsp20/alpha crystallin family protein [Chloroflexaceae bacterium]NJO06018.1 Hsp20/alpha crystallin family protein [Chloroflexaceae bacterium]
MKKPTFRFLAIRHYQVFDERDWQPALNMYETDQAVIIVAELAGIDPADLTLEVEANMVRIQGQRQPNAPEDLRRIHRMEMGFGHFAVEVILPTLIDPTRAESRYRNGLLEILLPLAKQPARRIAIASVEGVRE